MTKQQQEREIFVAVRYFIKKDYAPKGLHAGDVVLLIRNDVNKEYYVFLRRNKAHSCTCEGNAVYSKRCYHIDQAVQRENTRHAAAKAKLVEMPAQEVVKTTPVAVQEYRMTDAVYEKLKATAKPAPVVVESPVDEVVNAEPSWHAIDQSVSKAIKAKMRRDIKAKKASEDLGSKGNLNGNKAFSVLR